MKYLRLCFFMQGVAVTKTGFKRCTRPSATLIMAVGNVVRGRGQRCPRPCTTNHLRLRYRNLAYSNKKHLSKNVVTALFLNGLTCSFS